MPLLPFFRKQAPQEPTILSMTGVRLGQRLLIVAERDASIPIHLGAKVGLTGRVLAFGADEAGAARLASTVQAQGVLIDAAALALPLPAADASFDVAVLDERHERGANASALLVDVRRVLRPGGRLVVLRRAGGRWTQGLFGRQPEMPDVTPLIEALAAAGFHNPRPIGVRDGSAFVEAMVKGER